MAENKKSFLLYVDQRNLFHALTDEEAGKLIKHIYDYVSDLNPNPIDRITQIAFEPIKHQLKRDLVKYSEKVEQWSEAGKASAEARRLKKENELKQSSTDVNVRSNRSTVSSVTDIVTVTDIDIYLNIENFQKFRNSEFENLDQVLKTKLKSFGITKPIIRNTNNANRQYVDVVEILVYIFNSIDWSYTTMMNLDLNEERFRAFMRDFIKTYVSDSSLNYDESKFQGHFVNWVKKKI